jgi:tRNA pseudouridine38-40 synthase
MFESPGKVEFGPAPGFRRLRFLLAYNGLPWRGWQSMPCGMTIQDEVNRALRETCGGPVRSHGSGRTDAGVHALGQVAHADVPETARLAPEDWVRALNARLPDSIRVLKAEYPAPSFHARFDARGKTYRYRIWRGEVMSPFETGRAWHLFGRLDMDKLAVGARMLEGSHDFARLSANRGGSSRSPAPDGLETRRTLSRVEVRELEGSVVEIEYDGDGFLYKMARMLTGSLAQIARGRESLAWLEDLLANPRGGAKSHHTAPAHGLYLVKVWYE